MSPTRNIRGMPVQLNHDEPASCLDCLTPTLRRSPALQMVVNGLKSVTKGQLGETRGDLSKIESTQ